MKEVFKFRYNNLVIAARKVIKSAEPTPESLGDLFELRDALKRLRLLRMKKHPSAHPENKSGGASK